MNPSKNVVCAGCTLLCDDIEITNSGSQEVAKNACEKGQAYFQIAIEPEQSHSVRSKPVDLEAAIQAAAGILNRSAAPLICGLDHLTTEAQQAAWKLADKLGATIDTTMSNHGRSGMFALQRVGKVTASLGEIANRSDLILFWFCDPESTHPRLLERLNKSSDHPSRQIIVIDETETLTGERADLFIRSDHESGPAILATLRAKLANHELNENRVRESTGLEPQVIDDLARALAGAKYGSVMLGQTASDSAFDLATESLSQLVRQLNNLTRFVAMKLRNDANAKSAENVLAWSSGYPFAVNHHCGYPRYNWLEYSAETVLTRGECDAVLFATGTDLRATFAGLSRTARDHLSCIPKIALTPFSDLPSDVAFQVGCPGLNESGEFCRLDDVSLPLASPIGGNATSASEILERLFAGCQFE